MARWPTVLAKYTCISSELSITLQTLNRIHLLYDHYSVQQDRKNTADTWGSTITGKCANDIE